MPFFLSLVSLLICAGSAWAADQRTTMTLETFLHWVESNRDAVTEFEPGAVLKSNDIDKVRPYIHPGYMEEFEFPGAEFPITATGDYSAHQAYLDATERFATQTRLRDDGSLQDYIAGQPFPNKQLTLDDPLTGLKIGWNFNFRWQHYGIKVTNFPTVMIKPGGTYDAPSGLPPGLIESQGTIERVLHQRYQRVYHSHLSMLANDNYTLPLDGASEFEWKDINDFTDPYEMRGLRVLIQRSSDPHRPDQAWTYVPSLRKVRRVSAEEKADSFQGSDTTLDDFFGFSGRVLEYDWTFHGRVNILHIMNSPHEHARFYGPAGRAPLGPWELRRALVVVLQPKRANHPYSSKVLLMDTQTYRVTSGLAFDQEGHLWKVWGMQHSWSEDASHLREMNEGTRISRYLGVTVIDLKTNQASLFPALGLGYPKVAVDEVLTLYDVNKLTEGRR